jgi:hypothetical protein
VLRHRLDEVEEDAQAQLATRVHLTKAEAVARARARAMLHCSVIRRTK